MELVANQPHAWIYLTALAAAVVGVRWFYRRAPENMSRGMAALLAVMRGAALACLIVLLMEPVLSLVRTSRERPVVAVLLDASRSMAIDDGTAGAVRGEEAVALLDEIVLPRAGRDAEIAAFTFAGSLEPLATERQAINGPVEFTGEITDIASAFDVLRRELAGRNLGAVVIATDGATNVGASPYDAGVRLGVPVFTLGVGESDAGMDIAVREATTNRVSYSGESLPIRVRVSSFGFADGEAAVELREGNDLLDTSTFALSRTGEESEITFRVTPDRPGIHRYSVSVPPVRGERLTANNTRVAVTDVVKGRIRVLLAAPRPSHDLSFLRREYERDPNVELDVLVGSERAGVLVGAAPASLEELTRYDLVVIVEPAVGEPLPDDWLSEYVESRGGGLLLAGLPVAGIPEGEGRPDNGASGLAALSPIVSGPAPGRPAEGRVSLAVAGESSPVTRLVSDRAANIERWLELPPVWTLGSGATAAGGATVLVSSGSADVAGPVLATARHGAGQVMSIAAEGVWRWGLAADEAGLLGRLAANAARWLTARGELTRVVLESDRDVYATGERVGLTAQVYTADFRPAADADVSCTVSRGQEAAPLEEFELAPDGELYRAILAPLPPGRYTATASAVLGGEDVGRDATEFTIEEFSLEDAEVRRRSTQLARLSDETGGGYYTPETVGDFPEAVPLEWTARRTSREIELWNSPWVLVLFVGLMGAEWALRRSKGLP